MNKKNLNHDFKFFIKTYLMQDKNPSHKRDYRETIIKNVGRLNRICVDHKSLRTGVKQEVRGHLL